MKKALGVHIFAGGFTLGVRRVMDVQAHFETSPYGVSTSQLNLGPDFPIFVGSEDEWPAEKYTGKIDFMYANPPCAIFSPIGIRITKGKDAWRSDQRTECWWQVLRTAQRIKPKVWCLESVPQAYTTGREMVNEFTKIAGEEGYSVTHLFTNSVYTGIPQARKRFFFVAHKTETFNPTIDFNSQIISVGEALANVQPDDSSQYVPRYRNPKSKDRFWKALTKTKPGDCVVYTWQKMYPNFEYTTRGGRQFVVGRPAFTLHRLPLDTPCGAYVGGNKQYHPIENRALNFTEAKVICGYPPEFQISEKEREDEWSSLMARAVMPTVGEWLAREVDAMLQLRHKKDFTQTVRRIDLRKPGIAPVDITEEYCS